MRSPLSAAKAAPVLCVLPLLAHAQTQPNPADAAALPTVVIEATKLGKDAFTLTQSATVIDQEDIERGGYTDLTEVLRTVPGMDFKQVGGPGQYNYLKLRGYSNSAVLVVVDGVTMNLPSSGDVGNLLSQFDPSSIARIEILRGPQTVLYGSNATAGVIAITTKRGTAEPQHSVAVEYGSLGWKKGKASFQQANAVGDGKLNTALYLSKTDSKGLNHFEGFKDEVVQASVDYTSQQFDAGVALWHAKNRFNFAQLKEVTSSPSGPTYWGTQMPDPNAYNKRETNTFSAYLNHRISDTLSQRLQYGWTQSRRSTLDLNDGLLGYVTSPWDGFTLDYVNKYPAGAQVPFYDSGNPGSANYRDKTQQVNYTLSYGDKHIKALGGIELYDGKAKQWGIYGKLNGKDSRKSFYANGEYGFDSGTTVSAGLRHDRYDVWGNKTTGSVGVNQKLGNATVFGNFATSYGAPNLSQLYNPTYGSTDLKPESGKTLELGMRQALPELGLNWEASLWSGKVKDVVLYDSAIPNPRNTSSGFGQYANGDRLRTRGLELSGGYRINAQWQLKAAYTYTDSQTKKKGAEYARTVQVARHKGNLGVSYARGPLTVDATAIVTDKRYDWTGRDWIPGYVRVDLAARYALNPHVSLYTRVENLFNATVREGLGYKPMGIYGVVGVEARF